MQDVRRWCHGVNRNELHACCNRPQRHCLISGYNKLLSSPVPPQGEAARSGPRGEVPRRCGAEGRESPRIKQNSYRLPPLCDLPPFGHELKAEWSGRGEYARPTSANWRDRPLNGKIICLIHTVLKRPSSMMGVFFS